MSSSLFRRIVSAIFTSLTMVHIPSLFRFHLLSTAFTACSFLVRTWSLVIIGVVTSFRRPQASASALHSATFLAWRLPWSLEPKNFVWTICVSVLRPKPGRLQTIGQPIIHCPTQRSPLSMANLALWWLFQALGKVIQALSIYGYIFAFGIEGISSRPAVHLSRQLMAYFWSQELLYLQVLRILLVTGWEATRSMMLNCLMIQLSPLGLISWDKALLRPRIYTLLQYWPPETSKGSYIGSIQQRVTNVSGGTFSNDSLMEDQTRPLNNQAPESLETAHTDDASDLHDCEFTGPVTPAPLPATKLVSSLACRDRVPLPSLSRTSSVTLGPSATEGLNSELATINASSSADVAKNDTNGETQEQFYDPLSLFDCTESFMKDLSIGQCLGNGTFGIVFLGKGRDKQLYAIKFMKQGPKANVTITLEVEALKRIKNNTQWATQFEYLQSTSDRVLLATTYCPGGSLLDILEACDGTIPPENAKFYLAQLILAIHSIHTLGIIHHDIKLDNVMLDAQGNVKLIDFGLAVTFDHNTVSAQEYPEFVALRKLGGDHFPLLWATHHNPHTVNTKSGTEAYTAPEVWKGEVHSYGVDYFGAACVYHWLITGTAPFEYDLETDDFVKDKVYIYQEESGMSADEYSFLCGALHERPHKRLTVKQMKGHPLFATIDWDALGRGEAKPPALPVL